MNDFIKKILGQIKSLWSKWTLIQKVILFGIAAVVIAGVVALFGVSSSPSLVPVLSAPIRDQVVLDRILLRIDQENIKATTNVAGNILVADEATARRMRTILISEDLIPSGIDPWAIFDRERWTITDFERDVNFRRAQTQMITDHIRAVNGVDNASVTVVFPERELFASEQNPVTASIIITPTPGSDITENRKKIEGIQKLLKFAIEGLRDEYIVITDQYGNTINDFAGMAEVDRLSIIDKGTKLILTQEAKYRALVLQALQHTFGRDRVRDINIKFDMDLSKKTVDTTEYSGITIRPDNPTTPYDDSEIIQVMPRSSSTSTTEWSGTGMNPGGPPGVEGQTPPAFRDMSNLTGKMTQQTNVQNNELNSKKTVAEITPKIDRVTVSVNIDGTWKRKYDAEGNPVITPDGSIEREYTPVPPEQLRAAQSLVMNAIGYNQARGDSVTVQNIPIDRSKEFGDEDAAYFRDRQIQTTVIVFISGLTLLLIAFIIFRLVAREMERRKRLAEEEQARRVQALRESAMAEAEQEGVDVSISVEDRARMEVMESVVNLAKEHPEDCAQLIRTWILEE